MIRKNRHIEPAPFDPYRDPPEIKLDNVTVLAGGHPILQQVSVNIRPGEHVALIGPSGAGKSSLLALLLGWYGADQGETLLNGERLTSAKLTQLRQVTAWVDPAVHLWNATLFENLTYSQHSSRRPMTEVLETADLIDVLERLHDGLQSVLGEGGRLVSGGEGQRVRLGRALLPETVQLALLDEPFRGLDRTTRRKLLERTRTLWQNATLLCVTHDVDHSRSFDRVLIVENGTIIEEGLPDELIAEEASHYNRYLQAQTEADSLLAENNAWRTLRLQNGKLSETDPEEAA